MKRESLPNTPSPPGLSSATCAYGSLHLAATRYPQMKVIFVHVPSIPQMAKEGVPVMELETISKALEICLKTAVTDWKEHH